MNGWGWAIDNLAIQTDVTSVAGRDATPSIFSLAQNYPNPFNPTTLINYALLQQAEVELAIFNVRGQKVRNLLSQPQGAGEHSVQWDGRDDAGRPVASGVYIYRLDAKTGPGHARRFVSSRKMTLLK